MTQTVDPWRPPECPGLRMAALPGVHQAPTLDLFDDDHRPARPQPRDPSQRWFWLALSTRENSPVWECTLSDERSDRWDCSAT
jgi:hypothetical protein